MVAFVGNLFLYCALVLAFCLIILAATRIYGNYRTSVLHTLNKLTITMWSTLFIIIISINVCFVYLHLVSDFSVLNVVMNSQINQPILYKIAGSWGNHEGSMLLWLSALMTITMLFVLCNKRRLDEILIHYTLYYQCIFIIFFLAFIIYTCNPFQRIFPTPINGMGFNAILQDIGLVIHPPFLYLGYVAFSILYSMTAALISTLDNTKITADAATIKYKFWYSWIRPWLFFNWMLLTLGITLGSWWAYRELGWGGFWFWDPVENAALMPWIIALILVHTTTQKNIDLIFQNKSSASFLSTLNVTLFLATFIFTILGMFLVRSGIVTSVHNFASDAKRGVWILCFLICLILYAVKIVGKFHKNIQYLDKHTDDVKLSKYDEKYQYIMLSQLIFLITILFTIMLGTIYPIGLSLFGKGFISIGAPYFNITVNSITLLSAVLLIYGSYTLYMKNSAHFSIIILIIFLSLIAILLNADGDILNKQFFRNEIIYKYFDDYTSFLAFIGIFIGITICIYTAYILVLRIRNGKFRNYQMIIGHIAFAFLILGVSFTSTSSIEKQEVLSVGDSIKLKNYEVKLDSVEYIKRKNHIARVATLSLNYCDNINNDIKIKLDVLRPEIRLYDVEKQITYESAKYTHILSDIYVTISETEDSKEIVVRVYYRSMIKLIWIAGFLIAASAIISLLLICKKKIENIK